MSAMTGVDKVARVAEAAVRRRAGLSPGFRRLLEAADRGGAEPHRRRRAVEVVLREILSRLYPDEVRRLRDHLPADVRAAARMRPRPGPRREIVDAVAWNLGVPDVVAAEVLRSVASELAAADPAAAPALRRVLPPDLLATVPG